MRKLLLALASVLLANAMNAQNLFYEDFESMTRIQGNCYHLPEGWTTISDNYTNNSNYSSWGASWVGYNFSTGKAAASCTYTAERSQVDRWLISPAIIMPQSGSINLRFMVRGSDYGELMRVMVSSTGRSKTDFVELQDYRLVTDDWVEKVANLSGYLGDTIYLAFVNHGTNAENVAIDNVEVGVLAESEIEAVKASVPVRIKVGEQALVRVEVLNKGLSNLTNFVASYAVDGGSPVTETVSNINIALNQSYTYTFAAPFESSQHGNHAIVVTVSAPNGESDDENNNTTTCNAAVYDESLAVDRTILLEHFTTAQCPNCPGADERIHEALEYRDDVVWLSHHAGFMTDQMTVPENQTLLAFYNAEGRTYAPGMMLDRSVEFGQGPETPVGLPGQANVITIQLDHAQEVPSFVTVNLTDISYNASSRLLRVRVNGHATSMAGLTDPRIGLYLMEDSIYASQSGESGQIYHLHVMRHAISDVWGDPFTPNANGDYSEWFQYTLPSSYNAAHCKLVAFVGNYNAGDLLDRRISNATRSYDYITKCALGIDEVSDNVVMNLYPNPATYRLNITAEDQIRELRIANVMGQIVYADLGVESNSVSVNTEGFGSGMYIVTVKTNRGVATRRINVVH